MEPKYKKVKKELLRLFKERNFSKGLQLPTEFELMETHGFSRNTIRQALGELEAEHIVYRVHGKGSFFNGFDRTSPEKHGSTPQKSGLIGLVNFFFMDYIYPDIMRGIEDTIYKEGYSLALSNCNLDQAKEMESVKRLLDQGIKGLILEPSKNYQITVDHPLIKLLKEADIPVVTTHWNPSDKQFSMVTIDDTKAGYDATKYLLKNGHTNIGIIYKKDVQAGRFRYEGYIKALSESGFRVDPDHVLSFTDSEERANPEQGYYLTKKMLSESHTKPSAIFYFNDFLALQGYKAIGDLGLVIPDDISVIGFDDYRASSLVQPPLTTFEHPKYTLGKWAANILLEEMDSSHRPMPMQLIFEPAFIERASVGKL
jgi:GntR family transcriptional regulator of arabinose operon